MQRPIALPRQTLFSQGVSLLNVETWRELTRMKPSLRFDALNIKTCWVHGIRCSTSLVLREQRRLLRIIRERIHSAGLWQRGEVGYDGDSELVRKQDDWIESVVVASLRLTKRKNQ